MKRQTVFAAMALFAGTHAAIAAPSVQAQWDALSATGGISPQVLNEVQQKMVVPAGAPSRWQVILRESNGINLERQTWIRKGAIIEETEPSWADSHKWYYHHGATVEPAGSRHVFDSLGLVELQTTAIGDGDDDQRAEAFSVAQKIDPSQAIIEASISLEKMSKMGSDTRIAVNRLQLSLAGSPASLHIVFPRQSERDISAHFSEALADQNDVNRDANFVFDSRFGVFMPSGETVLDWQIGDQTWHSSQVSAALVPAQKTQANSLFARGFDLYKAGDFTGAKALIEAGQKIDPGNYLGWFTLAEIGRANITALAARNAVTDFANNDARVAYQHTIDLAPDTAAFSWNNAFKMYLPASAKQASWTFGDGCFEETCGGHSHKIVDYRLPGGDWHSKEVSAALSAADKQRAMALFSAGFDSFKGGDFVSAQALLQKGLAIDPGNYLAYFTLAESARSAWTNNPNDDFWVKSVAFYYYRRTVDLAPDTPEGIKAQAHIDGGL
jgi:Tfp pilus assembly protein PilF